MLKLYNDMYSFSRHDIFGPPRKNSFLEMAGVMMEEKDEIPSIDLPNKIFGRGLIQNLYSNNNSQHSVNTNSTYIDTTHSNHLFDITHNQNLHKLDFSTNKKEDIEYINLDNKLPDQPPTEND